MVNSNVVSNWDVMMLTILLIFSWYNELDDYVWLRFVAEFLYI